VVEYKLWRARRTVSLDWLLDLMLRVEPAAGRHMDRCGTQDALYTRTY